MRTATGRSVETWRALRALVARGVPAPESLRAEVATAAREGEVVLLALEADPALAPWLTEPARRQLVVDGHLELALALTAEALARHPIGRVALLKGSASAYLVYARPALRFRRDVDLLVEDLPAARAALATSGFVDHVEPARAARGPGTGRTWPMALRTTFGQIEVDLHRAIVEAPWCRPSVEAMLAAAMPGDTLTHRAPLPLTSPADTLVHTAVHLIENGLSQPLKHWVDLDRLARVVDPHVAAERARLHGARTALWMGLQVAMRWLDTPCAPTLEALGRPRHAALLLALLTGDRATPHRKELGRAPARHLARLFAADGTRARARYIGWALAR